MIDTIYRDDAIAAVYKLVANLPPKLLSDHKPNKIYPSDMVKALSALPSPEAVEAVKDCRNCRHGGYNDHWKTWFCYNNRECSNWDLWEPAEAVQGWIPVEEQPPVFPCLVCDANGNQPSVPLGIVTITDEEHGEWHIDGRLWDSPKVFVDGEWGSQLGYGNRIIAWMPLPEPYKGGDSECV